MLLLVLYTKGNAQHVYHTAQIKHMLQQGVHAVVRHYSTAIDLKNINKAIIHKTWAVTILDKQGASLGNLLEAYDKYYTIKKIQCNVYDEHGNHIKTIKKKHIEDIALDDASINDIRYKKNDFILGFYPYTVEYKLEATCKSLFALPHFLPLQHNRVSIEKALLNIRYNTLDSTTIKCYPQHNMHMRVDSMHTKSSKQYMFTPKVGLIDICGGEIR
jgi:hypothetical protein